MVSLPTKSRKFTEENYYSIFSGGKTTRFALDGDREILPLTFPEFYDVKITSKCDCGCLYCYMDSTEEQKHSENPCRKLVELFGPMTENEKPYQCAYGGGETTLHPEFRDVMRTSLELGIIPNYTTNGLHLTEEVLKATEEFCAGVAVSCHPHIRHTLRNSVDKLRPLVNELNFHHIISDPKSVDDFLSLFNQYYDEIDYFVLLPYISMGRAPKKDIDRGHLTEALRKEKDISKIAFGAGFYKYLEEGHVSQVSLYDPEAFSAFLDLETITFYNSSFDLTEKSVGRKSVA